MQRYRGLVAAVLLLLFLGGRARFTYAPTAPAQTRNVTGSAGLFSWNAEVVNGADEELFPIMENQGINVLYQNFSDKNSRQKQMSLFAEEAMKRGITVYHLTGSPSWGLDPEGEALCEKVKETAAYNRRIQRKFLERHDLDAAGAEQLPGLKGIVLDVEPYTLDEWDEDPDRVMEAYVSGMKKARILAKSHGLEVIACIPWFYDTKGQGERLEELIRDGCDRIAVMNYYRGTEIENIAFEAELADRYGKELFNIYELKKANGRGVKEINTYYNPGLVALRENYASVREAYEDVDISIAYHDYQALKEVLRIE